MSNRKLAWIGGGLLVAALLLGSLSAAVGRSLRGPTAPAGAGMMGPGTMGGAGLMGPGMMGPGMMGGPWTMGPGMMGAYGAPAAPVRSLAEAESAFQAYIARFGTPDLLLGEVMEFERDYYAVVKERSTGQGALELLADKRTGGVFPEYGPSMMWNSRYGPMAGFGAGMMGGWRAPAPGEQATLTPERARELAQQWLAAHGPESTAEEPEAFPGYYTLHISQYGKTTGMLSVNAATGQVWPHQWHGAFIAKSEAGR